MPPQVASVSRKPLSIALEEVSESKITYRVREDSEEAVDAGLDGGEVVVPGAPVPSDTDSPDTPA